MTAEVAVVGPERSRVLVGGLGGMLPKAAPYLVAAMAIVALVLRIWVNRKLEAPYILTDELLYASDAERLAREGTLPSTANGFLYPVLISPGWLSGSNLTAYAVAKGINVVLMTLAAAPVYLWARRLVRPVWALLAVVLVLALPSFVYTGTVMTENAFFPAFVLATFAIAWALERPTVGAHLLVLAAIALAIGIRQQGVILVAILAASVVLKVALELRASGEGLSYERVAAAVRPYRVMGGLLLLGAIAYVGYVAARGASLASGLGAYEAATSVSYSAREVSRWVVVHFAELTLTTGLIPLMALVVLTALALEKGNRSTPAERAFIAVAVPAIFLLVIQVGAFASRFSLRVEERNMFHLAPLLVLALVVWIDRGMPRPTRRAAAAAAAAGGLVLTRPVGELLNSSLVNDTFGLVPFLRLLARLGNVGDLVIVVATGAVLAGLVFALLRRSLAVLVIPAALLAFLLASSVILFQEVRRAGFNYRYAPSLGADANWVDSTVGNDEEVPIIGAAVDVFSQAQLIRWQTDFFNRSVPGSVVIGVNYVIDPGTGEIVPAAPGMPELTSRYLLADSGVAIVGRVVADRTPLVLFEPEPPVRVASTTEGIFPDGWTGPTAALNVFADPQGARGAIVVTVGRTGWGGPDVPATAQIRIGRSFVGDDGVTRLASETATRAVELRSGEQEAVVLRTPKPPFRIEIAVDGTITPTQFGLTDPRELGAQVSFAPLAVE
ncbi:MAG: glycosyltransferase family 39 protein [Gaiellales bacterium]